MLLAWCLGLVALAGQAATFIVTSTLDTGAGSLRQAILDANTNSGPDTIQFALSGNGPFVITPSFPLPAIVDALIVDGSSQPGYADRPVIAIQGNDAGGAADGLYIKAAGCTVRGLAIFNFSRDGIRVEGPGTNVIQGNHLGTDMNGTALLGNVESGLMINNSPGNLVGGTSPTNRNVISGGNLTGIYLIESQTRGNVIIGNFIGTDATGTVARGNLENGIVVFNASGNTIGGTNMAERNVISGNGQSGIYLFTGGATSNVVIGNYIGTSVWGTNAIPNLVDGVTAYGAPRNQIGGVEPGSGNVISGNLQRGVQIVGSGANGNLVQGNLIGTDATGLRAMANHTNGISISAVAGNVIGGTSPEARNVISGNGQSGVFITGNGATSNRVEGNFIGLDRTGAAPLPNDFNGVAMNAGTANVIGGPAAGAGNVISGNGNNGIFLTGGAVSNLIQGNLIGTDESGRFRVSNALMGVRLDSGGNTVGGLTASERNVISGNGQSGLLLNSPAATRNLVLGNYIGLDSSGASPLGNTLAGLGFDNAPSNTVGGAAAGARNVISANGSQGVYLTGNGAAGNLISGNYIGVDASGANARGNSFGGIYLYGSPSNTIGGSIEGAGNLVSGNARVAVSIGDAGANANVVAGNVIGIAADGITDLGNQWHGVEILGTAGGNLIGGTAAGAGNRIAFARTSAYDGVRIRDGCSRNLVLGNTTFSNGGGAVNGLGIDLGSDGVAPNDSCDGDGGGNQLQNYPVLGLTYGGSQVSIKGTLNSSAETSYHLQFFANNSAEPSGYGEGQILLGEAQVTTGKACSGVFKVDFDVAVEPGSIITATASDPLNNTSEFSVGVVAQALPPLTLESSSASQISLLWPGPAAGLVLEQTTNLVFPVQWTTVTNSVNVIAGTNRITVSAQGESTFYRLALE